MRDKVKPELRRRIEDPLVSAAVVIEEARWEWTSEGVCRYKIGRGEDVCPQSIEKLSGCRCIYELQARDKRQLCLWSCSHPPPSPLLPFLPLVIISLFLFTPALQPRINQAGNGGAACSGILTL